MATEMQSVTFKIRDPNGDWSEVPPSFAIPNGRMVAIEMVIDLRCEAMTRLAEAIERQSASLDTLAHVIASQYVEDDGQTQSETYLDGTPKE